MTNHSKTQQSAFTLIEIMAVIVIIGIIVTAVAVSFARVVPKYEFRKVARAVDNFVQETRIRAIREGRPYTIFYDLDENQVWRERGGIPEEPENAFSKAEHKKALPEPIALRDLFFGNQRKEESGRHAIRISARGRIEKHAIHIVQEGEVEAFWTLSYPGPGPRVVLEEGNVDPPEMDNEEPYIPEDSEREYIQDHQ